MADDQTQPSPAPDLTGVDPRIVQGLLAQVLAPQRPATAPTGPQTDPSFIGLLGSALGGGASGAVPMSGEEKDTAGRRALMNFGLSLLENSGWSTERRTGGQIFARGLGAAQQSMGQSEALTAARGQAQQDYARQQQEDQLARVKEAIPLLNLQQTLATKRALQNMPSPFAPGTSIGAAGTGGAAAPGSASADVPPELMPIYQAAAARTGIPVDVLIAQHKQESGFNNNLTGTAGEIGIGQIKPDTAANPGFGMAGIDPKTLRDPATNINFAADYLKARGGAAGVKNWTNPEEVNKALLAYNGGGDKDYVAHVRRYLPGQPPAAATTASAPTAPAAPVPRIAPDTTSPNVASTGQQFAGPGAPTAPVAPQPTAGAAGNANAIMAGMVKAGADPATLAPGGGGSPPAPAQQVASSSGVPAQTGGLVVPAGVTPPPGVATVPAAPPPVTPGDVATTFEEHLKQHPIVAPPDVQALFNAKPDADQLALLQRQAKLAETAYNTAKVSGDAAGMAKASEAYNTILGQENTVRENAAKMGRDAQSTWTQNRLAQAHDEWQKMREVAEARETERLKSIRDQTNQQQTAAQKLADDIKLKTLEGEQARLTGAAATENTYVLDQRKQFAADHDATRNALGDYQMLRAFSDAAGTSTPIDNLQIGDKTGREFLVQWGFGTQAQREKWGAQQAFNAVINKSILAARAGVSMGQLSDRDMNFLTHMTVSQLQEPQTRSDIISYLEQNAYRKKQYMDRVEQLWDGGKGLTWGNARSQAETEFSSPERDIVPRVPADWKTMPPQLQQQFLTENRINHGSLVRLPNGKLGRYEMPTQ